MVTFAVILALLLLVVLAFAQPGGSVTVSVSPQVAGLEWHGTSQQQRAYTTLSCTATGGPAGWTKHYQWSGTGYSFEHPTSPTTVAWAVGPGKRSVGCYVYASNPANPEEIVPLGSQSKPAVAIGGPLSFEVSEHILPDVVPTHDQNEPYAPFYIEFFDYTYGVDQTPQGALIPRTGLVRAYSGQPSGTTYVWNIIGPAVDVATGGNTDPDIFVHATGHSDRGGIKVRLTYMYTDPNDQNLTGSAEDNSEETPPPGSSVAEPDYYSFTAHCPQNIETLGNPIALLRKTGDTYPPGEEEWSYTNLYKHQLFDTNGDGQPGVWITERFPGFTDAVADWNQATGQTLSVEDAGSTGQWWTSVSPMRTWSPPFQWGELDSLDEIGLSHVFANAIGPVPPEYPALVSTQKYYAATKNAALNAWGIHVGTYTNTMTVTSVTHVKN